MPVRGVRRHETQTRVRWALPRPGLQMVANACKSGRMDPQTSRACFLKPQPASATLREPGRTLQQVKPTCAWIRMQHPEHHQARVVVCLSVPGSTYSILQGSTQRCVSEHTVPAGLLGAKAIKALMAVRLDKRGLPNRKCGGATFDVPAAMTLRNAAAQMRTQHERGSESCCHVQPSTSRATLATAGCQAGMQEEFALCPFSLRCIPQRFQNCPCGMSHAAVLV